MSSRPGCVPNFDGVMPDLRQNLANKTIHINVSHPGPFHLFQNIPGMNEAVGPQKGLAPSKVFSKNLSSACPIRITRLTPRQLQRPKDRDQQSGNDADTQVQRQANL